jgi:hypothetical protein
MTPVANTPHNLNTTAPVGRLRIRFFYFIAFIEMETLTEFTAPLLPFLAMWVAWEGGVNKREERHRGGIEWTYGRRLRWERLQCCEVRLVAGTSYKNSTRCQNSVRMSLSSDRKRRNLLIIFILYQEMSIKGSIVKILTYLAFLHLVPPFHKMLHDIQHGRSFNGHMDLQTKGNHESSKDRPPLPQNEIIIKTLTSCHGILPNSKILNELLT